MREKIKRFLMEEIRIFLQTSDDCEISELFEDNVFIENLLVNAFCVFLSDRAYYADHEGNKEVY